MEPILMDLPDHLTTERLLLRIPRPGDGALIFPAVLESRVELAPWMPWVHPEPTWESTETWCRRNAALFLLRESFAFSAYLKGTETCVGNCGMDRVKWDVPQVEIGYWQRTPYCGKGYATEAVNAVAGYAVEHLKARRIEIRCDPRNRRSAAVAERCGFALEGVLRCESRDPGKALRDTCVYARTYP